MINYNKINYFTENRYIEWLSKQIPDDIESIIRQIKEILIHPIEAREKGIRFNEKINNRNHAFFSSVNLVMENHPMKELYIEGTIPKNINDKNKMILSCDYFSLFLASFLRYKGYFIRLRTGYAKYIVPDMLIPHWITEVKVDDTWKIVDPERNIFDLDRKNFIFAGEAWLKRDDVGVPPTFPTKSTLRT